MDKKKILLIVGGVAVIVIIAVVTQYFGMQNTGKEDAVTDQPSTEQKESNQIKDNLPLSTSSLQPGEKATCKPEIEEYGLCNCEKKLKFRTHLEDDCRIWDEESVCTDTELEQCQKP